MADRSAAHIFGAIFSHLVKLPKSPQRTKFAKAMWKLASEFDFSDDQLHCKEALEELGFAWRGVNPEYPEDGETWLYDR